MKKIMIMSLVFVFVLSLSSIIFADDTKTTSMKIGVTISPYYDAWFVDPSPEGYKGLFGVGDDDYDNQVPIGEPGIYISDGNATREWAVDFWSDAGADDSMVNEDFFDEGQLDDPQVEMFKVDGNTEVDVTLSADWDEWLNAPTMLRVSSNEDGINGMGTWGTELAVCGNTVDESLVTNTDFLDEVQGHNNAVAALTEEDATFSIDFSHYPNEDPSGYLCKGPLEFHLNGALWLPKASMAAADEYTADVTITVAPAEVDSGESGCKS